MARTIGKGALALLARERTRGGAPARLSQVAATLYLGGAGAVLLTAWQLPDTGPVGQTSLGGELHLLLLLVIGSIVAVTTLAGTSQVQAHAPQAHAAYDGHGELMAHMSHALRTPLNAVIGFSEAMAREMHGPLGNSRYQEYAHHICESGGRLLKSSEDALAVTDAMTSLMTDRTRGRRETACLRTLVHEGWEAVQTEGRSRLSFAEYGPHHIRCERRATVQALEHLLHEAVGRARKDTVEVASRRRNDLVELEIRTATEGDAGAEAGSLRMIVARLLLQTQGATLTCTSTGGQWSAVVALRDR